MRAGSRTEGTFGVIESMLRDARVEVARFTITLASKLRFLLNPISLFIGLQTLSVTTIVLWVVWFTRQEDQLKKLVGTREWANMETGTTVAILVIGCILLGGILVLAVVWFLDGLRQSAIIKQQRNFLSSVTHEVRSPLASIQLALETLETIGTREMDASVRERLMAGAHQDIARLTRLVDQILIAARLDRGITLFAEGAGEIDLGTWLPVIAAEASGMTGVQSIQGPNGPVGRQRVVVSVEEGLQIWAPEQALRIIVENLIQNAIKYSPEDTPIELSAARKKNSGEISISVKDQGMGLEPHEIKQLFKIFRRGDRAVRKAIPGTGLGLYIVQSMTRIMGGRVIVESEGANSGSTFTVELPGTVGKR